MIVWLASYPRSGNTFLRILLDRFFKQKTYSKYNDKLDIGKSSSLSDTVGHLEYDGDWSSFYESSKQSEQTVFIKTHDKPEDDAKAIFIVRDGRSAAVSYWKYLRNHSKLEIDLSDVIAGAVSFGTWSSHFEAWDPEERPNTLIVKYEDLVSSPFDQIRRVGKFLGIEPRSGIVPDFQDLKENHPNFFRSGSNSDNFEQIPADEKEWMMMEFGPALKALGYVDKVVFDADIANSQVEAYQQKTLGLKREIAALADGELTSRLEGRLQNLKVDVDKEFSVLREILNAIGPEMVERFETATSRSFGAQQEQLLSELRKDLDTKLSRVEGPILTNIGKILVASEAVTTSIASSTVKAEERLSETQNSLLADIQSLISEKFEKIEKPIHENLNAVFGATNAIQNTLKDIQIRQSSIADEKTKLQEELTENLTSTVSEAVKSEVSDLSSELSVVQSQQEVAAQNVDQVLTATQNLSDDLGQVSTTVNALIEAREDRERLIDLSRNYISELEQKNQYLAKYVVSAQNDIARKSRMVDRLRTGIRRMSQEYDNLLAKNSEYEFVLQPRFRSLLELRPVKHILEGRKKVKALGGSAEALMGPPAEKILSDEGIDPFHENHRSDDTGDISDLLPEYASIGVKQEGENPVKSVSSGSFAAAQPTHRRKAPIGIAVYTFDRKDMVHNVLESLAQQNVLDCVHVFIDGDQGKPDKRKILDQTEELVKQYPVKIHRNRGNFGFRKMMLTSQRYMLERYEKIIFLEDDCFPTHNAVAEFSRELDVVMDDPSIFSVYGHPFLVPGEDKPFGRFQGWGWATTSEKLEPFWRRLMDLYLLTETEYLSFIEENLTKDLLKKIDITPGRQPSATLTKFFAWDETLCMLTAMHGAKHKRSDHRIIYNCGVGDSSAHFTKIDYYRKPPFNMVSPNHVWDYF